MGFPRHEWHRAVTCDRVLTFGAIAVAVNVSTSASPDDGTFRVKQQTVADRMGVSVRLVKLAWKALEDRGYIEVAAERKRGPGGHSAMYRLRIPPKLGAPACTSPTESGAPACTSPDRVRCTDRQSEVHGSTELGARIDNSEVHGCVADSPSTSENADNIGLYEGLDEGLSVRPPQGAPEPLDVTAVPHPDDAHTQEFPPQNNDREIVAELVDDDPDPQPPEHCPTHMPHGTTAPCAGCMRARKMSEAWNRRRLARILSTPRLEPARTNGHRPSWRCTTCRDGGIVLNGDGTPGSRPRICHHNGSWHVATAEELETINETP